jgi:outer membrane protein TolC
VIGVGVGAAPAQVQDARQRDSLLSAAQAEERIMSLRLMLARKELEAAAQRVESGVASRAALIVAQGELRDVELQLRSLQLNIEEIKATASAPRDDFAAPPIDGRDFVKERLQLEAAAAQRAMVAAEEAMRETARREAIGAEPRIAVQQKEVELEQSRLRLALLADKLELRKRLLESQVTLLDSERELRVLELQHALRLAQRQTSLAAARLEFVRKQLKAGTADRTDLLRAELEALERQTEMTRIETQLKALRSPGG